jgi:hypothetical protein
MAGCGYVCPQCEGKGFTDDGEVCTWCTVIPQNGEENDEPFNGQ